MTPAEPSNPPGAGCLLVLGMHRSGTSALAGTLARLGLSVGDTSALHPADAGNPSGYWEPAELVEINDALLESWGGSQRSPRLGARPSSIEGLPAALVGRMREYAGRWQAREAHAPFVWKDPRLCITLPLWRPLLPIRGFVVAARDPAAVADSLNARDGMSHQVGRVLWESYVRSLLAALGDTPRLVIRYEDLLGQTEASLDRLAVFAERTVGVTAGDRESALRGIERRTLPPPDTSASSPVQRHLYELLCEGTPTPEVLADPEVVALLDAATATGEQLTRKTFILHAAEAKIERLQAKAENRRPAERAQPGLVERLRRWSRR